MHTIDLDDGQMANLLAGLRRAIAACEKRGHHHTAAKLAALLADVTAQRNG